MADKESVHGDDNSSTYTFDVNVNDSEPGTPSTISTSSPSRHNRKIKGFRFNAEHSSDFDTSSTAPPTLLDNVSDNKRDVVSSVSSVSGHSNNRLSKIKIARPFRRVSVEGRKRIDFVYFLTKCNGGYWAMEKIFSYLSYKDISTIFLVSKTWKNVILNSKTVQKNFENHFIRAILSVVHCEPNVTEEYQQLYQNIIMDCMTKLQIN